MIDVKLTETPIDVAGLLKEISPHHGAQLVFSGVVRDHNHGRSVLAVSYDAHPVLTQKVLRDIAGEACAQWGEGLYVRFHHRVGRLAVGEVSTAIVVSSPHRDEVYQASRYLIEELKKRAPIWKKEHYTDGDSEWLQGHALCGHV